jgi:hypothetical protein
VLDNDSWNIYHSGYSIPDQFGVSICLPDWVEENISTICDQYIVIANGDEAYDLVDEYSEELYNNGTVTVFRTK